MKESVSLRKIPGSLDAERQKLVEKHAEFARAVAAKWHRRQSFSYMELDDMVSAAFLGLCDAALKYEPNQNTTFRSYCFHRICGEILDMQRKNMRRLGFITRLSRSESEYQRAQTQQPDPPLRGSYEALKEPPVAEPKGIEDEAEPEPDYTRVTMWPRTPYGMSLPGDLLTPESCYAGKEQRVFLSSLVNRLRCKERSVVYGYYFDGLPLSEVYPEYSLSYVSRIHTKALSRLKTSTRELRGELRR